jgi:hypothetical protein
MYLAGHGVDTIARTLNEKNTETFSLRSKESGWAQSTIRRLLRSVSVIGSYQPSRYEGTRRFNDGTEVENYYPAAIDKKTFYEVQTAIQDRRGIKGPKRSVMTLFTGIVKCALCGSPVTLKAGSVTKKRAYPWVALVCRKALRGKGCNYHAFRYEPFENAVLTALLVPILDHFYPTRDTGEHERLVAELQHVKTQISNTKRDFQNLAEVPKALWEFLAQKEKEETKLSNRIEALPLAVQTDFPYQEIDEGRLKPLEFTMETRLRVRAFLPRIVKDIVLNPVKRRATIWLNLINPVAFSKYEKIRLKEGVEAAINWSETLAEDEKFMHHTLSWPDDLKIEEGDPIYFILDGCAREYKHNLLWDDAPGSNFEEILLSFQKKPRRSSKRSR